MIRSERKLKLWLGAVIALVVAMVGVGGVTRLTGSGLSITEWKPILGTIPPLNLADWQVAFEKYQATPQFQIVNSTMSLGQFKWIFFWEYSHRLLGRTIGLFFALPLAWFWLRNQVPTRFKKPLLFLFALGGLQGALGWFMVKSGLVDLPYVSHFRLAAHLLVAFAIAGYALWIFKRLDISPEAPLQSDNPYLRKTLCFVLGWVVLQTTYGAFTAGLKAGFQFPTFPTFNGEWLPSSLWEQSPFWLNWVSNPVTVQWVHRLNGTLLVGFLFFLWFRQGRKLADPKQKRALTSLAHLAGSQYIVGICVVLMGVPVWLGAFHQVMGCLVFLLAVNAISEVTSPNHN